MLGEKIKLRLKELGLTQKDLALQMSISPSTLSGYITGYRTPDINTIKLLANALKVEPSYLIDSGSEQLTKKEKNDIAKSLDKVKQELLENEELFFEGVPMSNDSIENVLDGLEILMEQVRRKNKAKYTPKKYRKE